MKTRERLATYRPGGAAAFDVSLESSGAERAAVQGGELLLNPHPVHCTGCWQDGVNQGGRELVLDFHRNESGIHPFHIPLFAMHQGRRCGRSHVKPEDRMQNAVSITQSAGAERAPTSSYKGAAIYLFWGILFTFRGLVHLTGRSSHPSPAFLLVGICLPLIGGLVLCSLGLILLFGMASIGELEYRQISDRGVEQRVRDRYAVELDQLSSVGFSYDFTSGEAMSAARILLIYPAFILLQARANGAVLALGRGPRILLAAPCAQLRRWTSLCASADSWGHVLYGASQGALVDYEEPRQSLLRNLGMRYTRLGQHGGGGVAEPQAVGKSSRHRCQSC